MTMDPLWIEFRSSPSAYLSSRKMDVDAFVNDVLQVRMYELGKDYHRTTSLPCHWINLNLIPCMNMDSFLSAQFPWYYVMLH